jgi:hypothetical protein
VYAVQSPRVICVNDIVPCEIYTGPVPVTGSSWESICTQQWVHVFQIQWMSLCFDDSLELLVDSAIEVLLDMHFLGPEQLASEAEWRTLSSVLDGFHIIALYHIILIKHNAITYHVV